MYTSTTSNRQVFFEFINSLLQYIYCNYLKSITVSQSMTVLNLLLSFSIPIYREYIPIYAYMHHHHIALVFSLLVLNVIDSHK